MAAPALQVDGARQLRSSLKRAGVSVQDLKAAHKAVADMVATDASPRTPRRTGRLAGTLRAAGTQSAAIVRAGRSTVPYAGVIHWGWPAHGIDAQPWIAEAAERKFEPAQAQYLQALEAIIATVEGTTTP